MTFDDHLAEMVRRAVTAAVEPLRLEVERLRGQSATASLLSIPEAATRLGVSERTIQRWCKAGQVEWELVGTVRMVRLPGGMAPR